MRNRSKLTNIESSMGNKAVSKKIEIGSGREREKEKMTDENAKNARPKIDQIDRGKKGSAFDAFKRKMARAGLSMEARVPGNEKTQTRMWTCGPRMTKTGQEDSGEPAFGGVSPLDEKEKGGDGGKAMEVSQEETEKSGTEWKMTDEAPKEVGGAMTAAAVVDDDQEMEEGVGESGGRLEEVGEVGVKQVGADKAHLL